MIRNYLTVAVRSLIRDRLYSAISIAGLAIGMACSLLIVLYVIDELSYDTHHPNSDRIYSVIREGKRSDGSDFYTRGTVGALGRELKADFPEVESIVRTWVRTRWVRHEGEEFRMSMGVADPEVLDVFDLPLIQGEKSSVFSDPWSAIVTQAAATRIFGDEDPIGQVVEVDHRQHRGTYTISGVVRDHPKHSNIRFDVLTATPSTHAEAQKVWHTWMTDTSWNPVATYVVLSKASDQASLHDKMSSFVERHLGELKDQYAFHLQSLPRVHLYSKADYGIQDYRGGDIAQVRMLGMVALSILLIACVNFVSLSTARATRRAKEVGLRKVVGAQRGGLFAQFLLEASISSFVAIVLGLVLAEAYVSDFESFTQKQLVFSLSSTSVLVISGLIWIGTSLLAGVYPAWFLARLAPAVSVKGDSTPDGRSWVREGLVVCQFAASIALIVGNLVVVDQLDFVQSADLGFDKERIIFTSPFATDRNMGDDEIGLLTRRYESIKREHLAHPNILKATASRGLPGWVRKTESVFAEGIAEPTRAHIYYVDHEFVDAFGIEIASGRDFSREFATDSTSAYIVSESYARTNGWDPSSALGKAVQFDGRDGTVIGVAKDFHGRSLFEAKIPFVMLVSPKNFFWLSVRIKPEGVGETLAFLEQKWTEMIPNRPFQYWFLDDFFQDEYYQDEAHLRRVLNASSILAILIACMGMFGLASFAIGKRSKEVGVRKVLGASVPQIVRLLCVDFAKPIVLSCLLAWPLVYFWSEDWLAQFVYRIDTSAIPYVAGALSALAIGLIAVSSQSVRASLADPVDTLRNE
jgi:putative ABC transport system permease protein